MNFIKLLKKIIVTCLVVINISAIVLLVINLNSEKQKNNILVTQVKLLNNDIAVQNITIKEYRDMYEEQKIVNENNAYKENLIKEFNYRHKNQIQLCLINPDRQVEEIIYDENPEDDIEELYEVENPLNDNSSQLEHTNTGVLTPSKGVNYFNGRKETYYNLDMSGCVSIMRSLGNSDEYWIRSDGCKMLGNYIMCAANLSIYPRGSLVETSLGTAIVVDTGYLESNQIDIAVSW